MNNIVFVKNQQKAKQTIQYKELQRNKEKETVYITSSNLNSIGH